MTYVQSNNKSNGNYGNIANYSSDPLTQKEFIQLQGQVELNIMKLNAALKELDRLKEITGDTSSQVHQQLVLCNKLMNDCNTSFVDFSQLKASTTQSQVTKRNQETKFKSEIDDLMKRVKESAKIIQNQ